MQLEESIADFKPPSDQRPRMVPPPPVRLVLIEDARLPAPAGLETQLDQFYMGLLLFERDAESQLPVYRAENFRLNFDVLEPPIRRENLRPLGVVVASLAELEQKLIETETHYERRRGLLAGQEAIVLMDPAGNWLEITESREVR